MGKLPYIPSLIVCLNCGKELPQVKGKKRRQYCDSTCRSNVWLKKDRQRKKQDNPYPKLAKSHVSNTAQEISTILAAAKEQQQVVSSNQPSQKEYLLSRIAEVEKELENPPTRPPMGLVNYIIQKNDELAALNQQIQNL